jgi:hypothetical protein
MISIIEGIFGSKVGRIVAEIVLVLALIAAVVLHFEHKGAREELAKLQKSSAALVAKADADIAKETAAHVADVKANQEKTDAALAANTALQSALDQRVRDFDAYRRAHPDVPRSASGPGPASGGECGATSCGDLASQLAKAGDELAGSAGALSATLQSCQRDRDSLTGEPHE